MKISVLFSKLKKRIKAKLSPKKINVKTKEGKRFYLYNPPFNIETEIFWQGFENFNWERKTRKIWIELCQRADSILDIGANSGIFSVLAKVYNPESTVYAFEPQPNIYEVLEKNNRINNFDILCQRIAISDVNSTMPFYNYGNDPFGKGNTTAGSLNKEWRPNKQKFIEVDVVTLDSFIARKNIKKIDLLKIDVETLEAEVLNGYREHFFIHNPTVVMEIQNTKIGKKINSFFKDNNYHYFNIDESKGLLPTTELGNHDDRNYLICHNEKLDLIKGINIMD